MAGRDFLAGEVHPAAVHIGISTYYLHAYLGIGIELNFQNDTQRMILPQQQA